MFGVCIIHKKYIINFFPQPHESPYSGWYDHKLYLQTNISYTDTEKYLLECVFVYNFVSPNVNLLTLQACCIFVHVFALDTV